MYKNTNAFNQKAGDEKMCEPKKKGLNKEKAGSCNKKWEIHTECKRYPIGLEKKMNSTQNKIGYDTWLSKVNAES